MFFLLRRIRGWTSLLRSELVRSCAAFGEEFAAGSGAVGVAGEGEHFGVVYSGCRSWRRYDVVGEGLSPPPEREASSA